MKLIKLSLAVALATSVAFADGEKSDVSISANVAMTTNYIWRGMTQTRDSAAVQGGFDLDYKGLYAGVWGSNVDFKGNDNASMELDAYAGYASEIYGIGYDLGYIQYAYPNDSKGSNFGEAYASISKDFDVIAISAKYYLGVTTNDIDAESGYEIGLSAPLPMGISFDGNVGKYDNTGTYYLVGLTKGFGKFDFNVAYTVMDYEADATKSENNVVATISTSF
jgi:uncharacterized protein (TIGR02001 family)